MGFPSPQWSGEESRMIKSVFLAVVAAASAAPEADPQVILGGHPALPYAAAPVVAAPAAFSFAPVGAVHSSSVVKSVEVAPAEVSHEVTAHAVPVAVGYHGYGLHGYYGKRDADAAVIAGRTTVLSAPTPLIHNPPVLPVVHHAAVAPVAAYAGLGYGLGYHGLGYGLPHVVVKRDADPAVIAGRTTVLSAPTPLIHNPPVLPVVHGAPLVAAPAVASLGYAGLGYHGLGYGLPLAHAVVKRDAEADPAVVLGAYPYAHAPVVAPAVHAFASVGAVAHVPVVKAVVEAPAEVTHEVAAHHVPLAVGYHGYGGYPYYG